MDMLSRFHPLVREWFVGRFTAPTAIQTRAWEAIAAGRHTLISAPTGSGKTLAAFLWALNGLISRTTPVSRLRILYISPLKALNNDIRKNLARPLEELQALFRERGEVLPVIRTQTRSGDTPESERRALRARPPEILITTPESLNILLTSSYGPSLFGSLTAVILDEIHAVLESKRGTHLMAAVERLTRHAGEFQRIILSATVKPLETVAAFTGGFTMASGPAGAVYQARPVLIVEDKSVKRYDIAVNAPFLTDDPAAGEAGWGPLVALCREIIKRNRSTLFFAASRKKTEKLSRLINETEPEILAYSHHGALSREIRLSVEDQLKNGRLRAVVATGTLELGIDIGELDEVVLLQSSASVHQAVQRIGRAGHHVAGTSRGTLIPLGGVDLVHLGALARAVSGHHIESVQPPEAPLDVLAQIVLSLVCAGSWKIEDLFRFVRVIYPYRRLERRYFDQVIALLAGRYADANIRELKPRVVVDAVDGTVTALKGARFLLNTAGGTIPDRGYYELRSAESGARLGDLDEEFVWERNVGDTFVFGPATWRIQRITHNTVEVTPQSDAMAMAPFYRAEEQNRSFHFSALIGGFLEETSLALGDEFQFTKRLMDDYHFTADAAAALRRLLLSQKEHTKTGLPHRHHLVIEHCRVPQSEGQIGIVILHTFWGGRVNKPLADAFAFLWEDRFHYPLEHFSNNDCVIFHVPHEFSSGLFLDIVSSPCPVPALLERITRSNAFGALFRENAGRALLLPKARPNRRMPFWLTRLRAKNLLAAVMRFPEFPLLTETARNLTDGYYDLEALALIVEEIKSGAITISETTTTHPSPFASEIVWRMTNQFMYETDELKAREIRPWQTEEKILFDPRLLTAVPVALIAELERKLKRLYPGYAPRDAEELILLLQERVAIPDSEWSALEKAVAGDGEMDFSSLLSLKKGKIITVLLPGARVRLYVLLETVPALCRAFDLRPTDLRAQTLDGAAITGTALSPKLHGPGRPDDHQEETDAATNAPFAVLLESFLRSYGPVTEALIKDLFSVDERMLQESLNTLLEQEKIVYGRLVQGDAQICLCDRENYNRLLAMFRRSRRRQAPLLDLVSLPLWLAFRQGLLERFTGPDALPRAFDALLGWRADAPAWEEYLLPERAVDYNPAALDALLSRTDLRWTGSGKNKIRFSFPDDPSLLFSDRQKGPPAAAALFPQRQGRYALEDLVALSGRPPAALQEALWEGVWRGEISNTSFETLRQALALKFRFTTEKPADRARGRPNLHSRWTARIASAGFWYLTFAAGDEEDAPADPVEALEMDKERVRLLLCRYGCLFRELLIHEAPDFQWKKIFPALRVMELSGEITGGHFFKDIPGIQFMTEETISDAERLATEDRVFWMNAQDPASPCGKPLMAVKGLYPDRLSSTWLVFHGPRLVLTVKRNGAELIFSVAPDHPALPACGDIFSFLVNRAVNPLKHVKIATINGVAALKSTYRELLQALGFQEEYKALVMRKKF